MQSLRFSCLPWRSRSSTKIPYSHTRWLHHTATHCCNCSDPPSSPKPTALISNPPKSHLPLADHRAIGTALDLFSITAYSPGSYLFHPDGAHIFLKLQSFLRAQYANFGFREVITPLIYKQSLWEQSGHWENYQDDMFQVTGRGATKSSREGQYEIGEDEKFGLKPMNCPGHCLLFKSQKRSYRDLPIRYADFSPLHRNEISGALSGLTRGRRFHQDDGHIFCRPSQIGDEIEKTLAFVKMVYGTFKMGPYKLVLSTRPEEKFIGTIEEWERAETQLRETLDSSGRDWEIKVGDGAFYGPKIDIILKDDDGYEHQTATIQLDFQLPRRFGLTYQPPPVEREVDDSGINNAKSEGESDDATPVIIHRAILGSLERFMALLVEHCKGYWPFWLSPRQIIILTIGQETEQLEYAAKVVSRLSGIRHHSGQQARPLDAPVYMVDTDFSGRSISKKIAEAKTKRYNFICVIGKKETADNMVAVDFTGQLHAAEALATVLSSVDLASTRQDVDMKAVKLNQNQLAEVMKYLCNAYL